MIPGMIFGNSAYLEILDHLRTIIIYSRPVLICMRGSTQCSIHVSWLGDEHPKYCGTGGIFRISMLAESLFQVSFTGIDVKTETLKVSESAILCKHTPNRCFLQAISGNVFLWFAGPGL